jgi:hypothetical protein
MHNGMAAASIVAASAGCDALCGASFAAQTMEEPIAAGVPPSAAPQAADNNA